MRDIFLDSLDDLQLRKELLREKPVPTTMLEVLDLVQEREMFELAMGPTNKVILENNSRYDNNLHNRDEPKNSSKAKTSDEGRAIKNQLSDMRRELHNMREELLRKNHPDEIVQQAKKLCSASNNIPETKVENESKIPEKEPRDHRTPRCHHCQELGHIRPNCPLRRDRVRKSPVKHLPVETATAGFSSFEEKRKKVYLTISTLNKKMQVLLDTGCAHSVIGKNVIPDVKLEKSDIRLYTADGNELTILGETTFHFHVGGKPLSAKVIVTNEISELILGIDWLTRNCREWNFDVGVVNINNQYFEFRCSEKFPSEKL